MGARVGAILRPDESVARRCARACDLLIPSWPARASTKPTYVSAGASASPRTDSSGLTLRILNRNNILHIGRVVPVLGLDVGNSSHDVGLVQVGVRLSDERCWWVVAGTSGPCLAFSAAPCVLSAENSSPKINNLVLVHAWSPSGRQQNSRIFLGC